MPRNPRNRKVKKVEESSSDEEEVIYMELDSDSDSDSDYDTSDAEDEEFIYTNSSDDETESDTEDEETEDEETEDEVSEDDASDDEKSIDENEKKSLRNAFNKIKNEKKNNKSNKSIKNKKNNKNNKLKKKKKQKKNNNKLKKKKKIVDSESDRDYNSEIDDEINDDDIDDESKINILLQLGGAGGDLYLDEEEYNDEEDGDDCNSDDEKVFMKENYQDITIPDDAKKKTKKKKNKTSKSEEDDNNNNSIETEYMSLVSLRKDFNSKLQQHPKDKTLKKSVKDYDNRIKKLVKDTRVSNAKKYHKLIKNTNKSSGNEIDYFKKKLSHKEQTKVMNDLKEINKKVNIDKPYRITLLESNIPANYKACALQKLNVLKTMEPGDPEYYKLKHWVDAFMKIPFGRYKQLNVNMNDGIEKCDQFMVNAKSTLDKCTYGLDDAKMQIMQMLGQWLSNPSSTGTAIAIKGPMGTGKTTLVKEGISQILGREFAFIALGGNGDSSYLEGHSYTYEGSNWGKIVQILMDCKSMNPVIYFDELDKVSDTPRGEEIIGILTHLTDLSQNTQFHDKYFSEISFD